MGIGADADPVGMDSGCGMRFALPNRTVGHA